MDALTTAQSWPVPTASAAWITSSGGRQATDNSALPFPLASVTKPLFTYAVLVAIEEGTLSLDEAAGPNGSTIRHLLAHASGLGDQPDIILADVGSRRIYSNAGFELLGEALTDASGMSAATYLHEAVVEPLGMSNHTTLSGSPAYAATSTVDDLMLLAAEWLNPRLISPETMSVATTPQFPELTGVLPGYGRQAPNPWGLGFEIRGSKSPHWTGITNSPATFGHFGASGTFLWVDPAIGVACMALTDRDFGPWSVQAWTPFADAVIAEATRAGHYQYGVEGVGAEALVNQVPPIYHLEA